MTYLYHSPPITGSHGPHGGPCPCLDHLGEGHGELAQVPRDAQKASQLGREDKVLDVITIIAAGGCLLIGLDPVLI